MRHASCLMLRASCITTYVPMHHLRIYLPLYLSIYIKKAIYGWALGAEPGQGAAADAVAGVRAAAEAVSE